MVLKYFLSYTQKKISCLTRKANSYILMSHTHYNFKEFVFFIFPEEKLAPDVIDGSRPCATS